MKRPGSVTTYKRSNWPRYTRAANVIGAAYKMYKGRGQTKTKSSRPQNKGMNGITTFQKDVKQVYRYKRAPRALAKKWKRSRRTFINNQLKQLSSRKYHYHGSQNWTSAANQQAFFGWTTYGVNGSGAADGTGDLADMFSRINAELGGQGTVAEQLNGGNNARRYYYDHMRCRVVLTNTGTSPIFWEIYECIARKDVPVTPEGGTIQQFYNYMAQASNNGTINKGTGGGGVAQSATNTSASVLPAVTASGVTPFQYRHFCQCFKVLKVTRLQAAAGNTVSFDASDPRNLVVNWDNYLDNMAKSRVTKFYVVRQWGAVTATNPNNAPSSAVFEIERDYNLKVLDKSVPELNYITYT